VNGTCFFRCSSEVSSIRHSGYLLKRSNHPFRSISPAFPPPAHASAPGSPLVTTARAMDIGNGANSIDVEHLAMGEQQQQQQHIMAHHASDSSSSSTIRKIRNVFPSTRILHRPEVSTYGELEEKHVDNTLDLAAGFFGLDIDEAPVDDLQQQQQQHLTNETADLYASGENNNGMAQYDAFSPLEFVPSNNNQFYPESPSNHLQTSITTSRSVPISMAGATATPGGPLGTGGSATTMDYIPSFTSSAPYPINPSSPGPIGPNLRAPPRRQDSAPASSQSGQSEHGSTPRFNNRNHPADFIDPTDGHIWRAKYCVLEDGVLYFYRNATDGDSLEARREREQGSFFPHVNSDHHLNELYDVDAGMDELGKSPMPRHSNAMLSPHHREKNESFCHDMNVIWEKRVALDCVGAVRSAEQEYGGCSLELLAIGYEEQNPNQRDETDGTSSSGSSTPSDAPETSTHSNRLILRAGSTEEMNEWLFEFHRSLASFMRQIMNSVGSPGIVYPIINVPAAIKGAPHLPGLVSDQSVGSWSRGKHAGGRDSPSMPGNSSLSHGHGRNGLHRRLLRAHRHHTHAKDKIQPTSSASTPGRVSPVFLQKGVTMNRSSGDLQIPLYQQESDRITLKAREPRGKNKTETKDEENKIFSIAPVVLPCPKNLGDNAAIQREESTATTSTATTQAITVASSSLELESPPKAMPISSGKYIPPHLRNKQKSGGGKYVPPHLRNKGGSNGKSALNTSNLSKKLETLSSALQEVADEAPASVFEISLDDAIESQMKKFSSRTDTTGDFEAQGNQKSAVSSKIEPEKTDPHFKLGGCADPTLSVASILDPIYRSRKASKVGKVHSVPYGNFGGDCSTRLETKYDVRWEVGAVSECGIRESNEDAYLISNDLYGAFAASEISSQEISSSFEKDHMKESSHSEQHIRKGRKDQGLFAIFDGHCGNQAARFAAEKFPSFLFDEITRISNDDPSFSFTAEEHAKSVLVSAMARLDDEFCRFCAVDGRDWESGATALISIISDGFVAIANLGDCKGVMCSSISSLQNDGSHSQFSEEDGWQLLDDQEDHEEYSDKKWDRATGGDIESTEIQCYWKEVTESHSPSRDDERQRIEDAQGWITNETEIPIGQLQRMDFADKDVVEILKRCFSDRMNEKEHHAEPGRIIQISRICGELAVSRALGDRDFKAAYNRAEDSGTESVVRWEGPCFLPYPENHDRFFKGDLVSSTAEIQVECIGRKGAFDEFLLLACDGLWDVMDADDAVRVTRGLLFEKKWSAKEAVSNASWLYTFFDIVSTSL